MALPNKPKSKPSNVKVKDKKPPTYSSTKKESSTLFNSIDKWIDNRSKILLIIIFGFSALFSLLIFQARMDIGGDDSTYILRAYDFLHKGAFPSFQGPLYPMFLSIFVSFLGINVIFLKFLSIICNFIALLFLYKSFKGRVPSLVLYSVLILTAINTFILNYASLTYSEAFFMALQFIFFFLFFKLLDKIKDNKNLSIKESWKNWLLVGLLIFLLASARTVGVFALGGLILYFLIRRQYRYIFYLLAVFFVFYIPMGFIEKILWHAQNQFGSQSSQYMQKNPYNAADGTENFNGFIMRFFQNCDLYLSKRFFQIIGLRSFDVTNTITGLTVLFVLMFFFAFYRVIKSKNTYLLAASMYVLTLTGITFLVLQIQWDQPRLIMVFVPLYLMLFIYGLYDALKKRAWAFQFIGVFLVGVLVISEFSDTFKKTKENLPALSKNLHGDIYYGFTPDWVNYLKLSQWCENLPKDSLVACRKGPMSSVYAGGREFFNVVVVDSTHSTNADSDIAWFKRSNVRYVLLAKLRLNPNNPDQGFINTMHRLISPIARKYPQKIKFIRQEGTTEEAQLYEINY
jgi:hypothetical protein